MHEDITIHGQLFWLVSKKYYPQMADFTIYEAFV